MTRVKKIKFFSLFTYAISHDFFQRASLFTDLWFLWLKWSEPLWLNNIVGRFSATLFALRGDQNEPKCSQTNYCWKKIKQETHTHQWSRNKSWLCKVLYCLPHCLTNLWFFYCKFLWDEITTAEHTMSTGNVGSITGMTKSFAVNTNGLFFFLQKIRPSS